VASQCRYHLGRDPLEHIALSVDRVVNTNFIEAEVQALSDDVGELLDRLPIKQIPAASRAFASNIKNE
jgi:hypothetical protein